MVSDGMTGSNPVSPASSSSPASSGAGGISPQHIAQDSSLDGPPGPPDGATVPLEGFSLSQVADLANKGPKWEKSHAEIAEQAKHVRTQKPLRRVLGPAMGSSWFLLDLDLVL